VWGIAEGDVVADLYELRAISAKWETENIRRGESAYNLGIERISLVVDQLTGAS